MIFIPQTIVGAKRFIKHNSSRHHSTEGQQSLYHYTLQLNKHQLISFSRNLYTHLTHWDAEKLEIE